MRWLLETSARLILGFITLALAGLALIYTPQTPLPPNWNPARDLDPLAEWTPVSTLQLRKAEATHDGCLDTLARMGAAVQPLPPLNKSPQCHIQSQVRLSGLRGTKLKTLDTSCRIALRTALWEHHDLQPLAQQHFGQNLQRIQHFGSYSCRTIAGSERMSQHATANAIDIAGFDLADGTKVYLPSGWTDPKTKAFFEAARDSACRWFHATLGPDFNAAHADHFHLDLGPWRSCR